MSKNLTSGINGQYKPLVKDLCLLSCFAEKQIKSVTVIDSGLSQPCFKIQVDDNEYFAKHVAGGNTELSANKLTTGSGIAPRLIYGEGDWLISEFLSGELLLNCKLSEDEKLAVMLSLLAKCHRLPYSLSKTNTEPFNSQSINVALPDINKINADLTFPRLAVEQTISQLFQALLPEKKVASNHKLSSSQYDNLAAISESVIKEVIQTRNEIGQSNEVFCHGDANFTNVIKLEKNSAINTDFCYQLIDFECACIAPIEYDLAMLMAVNEIENSKVEWVIAKYFEANIKQSARVNQQESYQRYSQSISEFQSEYQQKETSKIVDNIVKKLVKPRNTYILLVTCYYYFSLFINGLWYLSQYQYCKLEKYKKLANKQFLLLATRYPETTITID